MKKETSIFILLIILLSLHLHDILDSYCVSDWDGFVVVFCAMMIRTLVGLIFDGK